jgi:hypothetical protein
LRDEQELGRLFELVEEEWWWSWVCGFFRGTAKVCFFLKRMSVPVLRIGDSRGF